LYRCLSDPRARACRISRHTVALRTEVMRGRWMSGGPHPRGAAGPHRLSCL